MSPNSKSEKPVNPNEHLHIPKWVNEDYFLPILQKDVEIFDKIVNFTPIAATAPGENYTSIMIRVIVDILLKGLLINWIYKNRITLTLPM